MVLFFSDIASGKVDLSGSRIVLPSLTIGNVGQLAVDLLISTLTLPRIGFLEDDHVVPMAGNDTFTTNQGKLSCAIEVYYHSASKTAFIQLRSPVAKGYNRIFAKNLVEWIKATGFGEVVMLASADASYRNDAQLFGQQLRYAAKGINNEQISNLQATPLEEKSFDLLFKQGSLTEGVYQESVTQNVPILVLTIFCSEGDNIPESIQLTEAANQYLRVVTENTSNSNGASKWKPPNSWTLIQGGPFEVSLFQ